MINKMVAVVFGATPDGEKDPNWAKPWQTHKELIEDDDDDDDIEVDMESGVIGKMINKMVAVVFGATPDGEKDPKWAKPWQTHKELIEDDDDDDYIEVDMESGVIGKTINKMVAVVFGATPDGEKDPKWATPWQTHKELIEDDDVE